MSYINFIKLRACHGASMSMASIPFSFSPPPPSFYITPFQRLFSIETERHCLKFLLIMSMRPFNFWFHFLILHFNISNIIAFGVFVVVAVVVMLSM